MGCIQSPKLSKNDNDNDEEYKSEAIHSKHNMCFNHIKHIEKSHNTLSHYDDNHNINHKLMIIGNKI